jgi:hypothetical protein
LTADRDRKSVCDLPLGGSREGTGMMAVRVQFPSPFLPGLRFDATVLAISSKWDGCVRLPSWPRVRLERPPATHTSKLLEQWAFANFEQCPITMRAPAPTFAGSWRAGSRSTPILEMSEIKMLREYAEGGGRKPGWATPVDTICSRSHQQLNR